MRMKYFFAITAFCGLSIWACKDSFLDLPPQGAYSSSSLANLKGVEGMLINTYAALDGSWFEDWSNNQFNQNGGASNWIWGGVRSDDAYKGTEPSDGVDLNPIERYEVQPSNPTLLLKWRGSYDGIGKANETLRTLALATDIGDADRKRIEGEVRFLRAHFHFEARRAFLKVPFVDETVTDFAAVTNDQDIYPNLEADLQFAYENLPGTQINAGRANKWAAGAYLGKVYMYQGKWAEAREVLRQVVQSGTTAAGTAYALCNKYHDNFSAAAEIGNPESIFAYESSQGGDFVNGNYENTLNQPHGSSNITGCCGFYQPSQNLVNSFKTDANGLPLLTSFNDSDVPNDEGIASADPFTTYAGTLDPRLDWTVGRRGIPFLDWGIHPGNNWIRQVTNGGPYSPIKNVPMISDFDANLAGKYDWGFIMSALNVHIIRLADVYLMYAEACAETNDLGTALEYVNKVRTRAANPDGFVKLPDGSNAANYTIQPYPAFASQADALRAIRFERKLELGMEGVRFFDLVRWDEVSKAGNTGLPFDIADYINNEYLSKEIPKRPHLANTIFTAKYAYLPIPEYVITQSTVNGVRNIEQIPGF